MSITERRIAKLKIESKKLCVLLDDPQPGLITWINEVALTAREIGAIVDGKRDT